MYRVSMLRASIGALAAFYIAWKLTRLLFGLFVNTVIDPDLVTGTVWDLIIFLSFIYVFPFLVSAALGIVVYKHVRPRLPANCCTRCSYDLTGNVSGICPECGTPTTIPRA